MQRFREEGKSTKSTHTLTFITDQKPYSTLRVITVRNLQRRKLARTEATNVCRRLQRGVNIGVIPRCS